MTNTPDDTTRLDSALDVAVSYVNAGEEIPRAVATELRLAARESLGWDDDTYARAGLAAMRLAPDLEICKALLRGERVPRHRLDPNYLYLLEKWPKKSSTGSPGMM